MKLKLITAVFAALLGSGCVAYVQQPDLVRVRLDRPVITVRTPPVVHVHHRHRRVVRTVHHHHHQHTVVRTHHRHNHRHRCTRGCRRH